jgi:hypothetical protein
VAPDEEKGLEMRGGNPEKSTSVEQHGAADAPERTGPKASEDN